MQSAVLINPSPLSSLALWIRSSVNPQTNGLADRPQPLAGRSDSSIPLTLVFVAAHETDAEAELALPEAIGARLSSSGPVFVHVTEDDWTGVTYPDDVESARERVRQLIRSGRYAERLSRGADA